MARGEEQAADFFRGRGQESSSKPKPFDCLSELPGASYLQLFLFGLPIVRPIWCVLPILEYYLHLFIRALVKTARCEDARMKSTFSAKPAAISPRTERLATSTITSIPTMNTSKPWEKFCLHRIFIAFSGLSLVRLRNYGSAQCVGAGSRFFLFLSITFYY